jgi:hypothetical protein
MKTLKTTLFLTLSLLFLFGCNNDDDSSTESNSIEIGDFHEGGVVFYLDSSGEH